MKKKKEKKRVKTNRVNCLFIIPILFVQIFYIAPLLFVKFKFIGMWALTVNYNLYYKF